MAKVVGEHFRCWDCLNGEPARESPDELVWCSVTMTLHSKWEAFCQCYKGDTSKFQWQPHLCYTLAREMENVQ